MSYGLVTGVISIREFCRAFLTIASRSLSQYT